MNKTNRNFFDGEADILDFIEEFNKKEVKNNTRFRPEKTKLSAQRQASKYRMGRGLVWREFHKEKRI